MILNLRLEKFQEDIVNDVVKKGIASNKSEAIRMMVIHYNECFGIRPIGEKRPHKEGTVKEIAEELAKVRRWNDLG